MFYTIMLFILLAINFVCNIAYIVSYTESEFKIDFEERPILIKIPMYIWYWASVIYFKKLLPFLFRIIAGLVIAICVSVTVYFLATPNNIEVLMLFYFPTTTLALLYTINYIEKMVLYIKKKRRNK